MKRSNSLIYCGKCKANRSMKKIYKGYWVCNACESIHVENGGGRILYIPKEENEKE